MSKEKICCFFNYASHYRKEIYLKMEREIEAKFFFGNVDDGKIKKIDYSVFKTSPIEYRTVRLFSHFVWVRGTFSLIFKKYRQYIITGEYYNLSTWLMLLFNRVLGKQTYLWTHGWYGNETGMKKVVKKIYYRLSSGVLLYGEYAQRLMVREGFDRSKLHVIYNSLEYDTQVEIRHGLTARPVYREVFKNDNPVLIFTGRLTKVKKLDQLLRAQKLLLDQGVPTNVFIVGEGPERARLDELISELDLTRYVFFYGACYDEGKIADFYYNASLCVSPGNVGLTGIHAMTYGCPVVSHNNFAEQMPEFEVIEQGKTGYFFEKDDIVDLTDKIKLVFETDKSLFRANCFDVIDNRFNTRYQIKLLKEVTK